MAENEEPIIGIDLGTTNSEVAILEGEKPVVIVSSEGSNRTPSVVAFLSNGDVAVGDMAVRQAATNPTRTISVIKRLMGRFYSDLTEEDLQCPYRIIDHDDEIMIDIDGKGYTPPQLSSLILGKLKATAEEYLGTKVKKAVITVPAYFDDLQREATAEAGRLAGLEVLRLINEPTAAAMAYGLDKDEQETIAVYDFGGGTFDLSILEVDRNSFEVITSLGDTHLGGEDIDRALLAMICGKYQEEKGVDLAADPVSYYRLKEAVEKAKCELSAMKQARLNLPFIATKDSQPIHLDTVITREELEELVEPLTERTTQICKRALQEAGLKRSQIGKVILVGGTSRIPLVQQMVGEFFDQEPFKGVNPDEAVALGAATQGAVFGGKLEEVILLDVTPHSLGIEVLGSRFSPIIEKNSTIPIKAGKIFTTTEENQEFVTVHVLQGESQNAADNRSIGKFMLAGLTPRPKGSPRIQVVFFINSDGIVEISAKDLESGAEKSLKVVHSHLSEKERNERSKRRSKAARGGRRKAAAVKPEFEGVALPEAGEEDATALGESFAEVTGESALVRPAPAPAGQPEAPTTRKAGATAVPRKAATGATPQKAATGVTPKTAAAAPSAPAPPPTAPPAPPAPVAEPAPAAEPAPGPSAEIPESVRMTEAMLAANKEDTSALLLYESTADAYKTLIAGAAEGQPMGWAILSLARVYALRKQPDEAMALLREAKEKGRLTAPQLSAALDGLIERFPNYGPALIERAQARSQEGRMDEAIEDAEQAVAREETNDAWADVLESLYRQSIVAQPDPAVEFKMVKLFLQRDKVDEAIEILQRLTENPEYEKRALKILGLCFWQKNLYYLAWQKFKQIELNEEIKDVLYRLAADMENADQLSNARQVLDHLAEADSNYRDIKARLQRIGFQIKAQQEDLERAGMPETHQILKDSRFIILEEINRGSMGVIYRAKDVVLDEVVALKVLNDYLCADPMAIERFKTEARAARKLTHRNIVRIHDFFESGKKKFISMEYIEGKDLKTILKEEGPLQP